ncbi:MULTISPECIES: TetR/AcrR family transcriptional regulator [Streptomyces]|uniref:TetR/AcrR family transcriptional regulator n=1 Tax=Streptomyces lienomycini TaxID=284035 RepID=A0ABV9WPE1_9ACTN|nr:TetR/AcrR family transcriptional regulator [Streptomyces lienomycini]
MGRHKQPEIRDRILDACVDHALTHGLPHRLEPFVTASGTSARMLIYHFGSRDALLRETLGRARRRQRDFFGELVAPRPGEPYPSTLRRAWQVMTGPSGRPYLTMFGRLREDAEQQLWPDFRRESTTDWLQPLEDGMRSVGRPELATLVLAVVRGLIMDIETTGDVPRADRAFDDFLAALVPVSDKTPAEPPEDR